MINFLKYKTIYFAISIVVILIGLISIVTYGYRVSIDFAGGTVIDYRLNKAIPTSRITTIFQQKKIKVYSINKKNTQYTIRSEAIAQPVESSIKDILQKQNNIKIDTLRVETVGPVIGKETFLKTIFAALVAITGILFYMTFAFKNFTYGLAAILAMLHDFLVVIGCYSLLSHFFGAELDSLFVTALLTTMAFSVHDTIIVFDKIREYRKADKRTNIELLANAAFTETIVRSFNNSLTIMLMLTALLLLGGETIKFFIATLLIGTITGTYSSPFIATPILAFLEKKGTKNSKH